MIDRLQFPGQQSPGKLALAPRKAGHATNHKGSGEKSAIIRTPEV
jgi:hypothetical protein